MNTPREFPTSYCSKCKNEYTYTYEIDNDGYELEFANCSPCNVVISL